VQDWLFIAAKRISAVEYALLLATFGLVIALGLEAGIAAGTVLAALHFAYR
jgi:SulP family sulfate permease